MESSLKIGAFPLLVPSHLPLSFLKALQTLSGSGTGNLGPAAGSASLRCVIACPRISEVPSPAPPPRSHEIKCSELGA